MKIRVMAERTEQNQPLLITPQALQELLLLSPELALPCPVRGKQQPEQPEQLGQQPAWNPSEQA